MKNEHQNIDQLWLNTLKKFFGENINIVDSNTSKSQKSFTVEKVLGCNVNVSNKWGFITLKFSNKKSKQTFLSIADIEINIYKEQIGNLTGKKYNIRFPKKNYPCRVFPESSYLTITFSDLENCVPEQLLRNRLVVFETVMTAILRQKIQNLSPSG